jgi:peptidylamidoglycolate lyase
MKKRGYALLMVVAVLGTVSTAVAQRRGLPPNVPPNPNWIVTPWGEPPNGSSWLDLKTVNSMTYDPNGKGSIVVMVTPQKQSDPSVWVFNFNGKLQKTWGANMFVRPYDLIVDRFGYLWIIDLAQNFVAKFTEDGKQLMTIGQKGVAGDNTSHDAFNGPCGLAVAKNGDIFIADGYTNSRIMKFDKNGKFLMMIGGTKGSEIGQFDVPHHVLIDSKDELVIQDRVNKRIQFWTQDGKFIKQWTDIELGRPAGFAIQPDDTIYITDSDGQSIKIIKDDKVIDAIGGLDGMRPHQIAIDPSGALYVNDEPFRIVKKIVRKSSREPKGAGKP